MSKEEDKIKHSRRKQQKENYIHKQLKIAKAHNIPVDTPHTLAKHSATTCGDSNCVMCGNPRKFFKEPTIQERRFDQRERLTE